MRGLLMYSTLVRQPRTRRAPAAALRPAIARVRLPTPAVRLPPPVVALPLAAFPLTGLAAGLTLVGFWTAFLLADTGTPRSARSIALATAGIGAMPSTDFSEPCQR